MRCVCWSKLRQHGALGGFLQAGRLKWLPRAAHAPLSGYDPERRTLTDSMAAPPRLVTRSAAAPAPAGPPLAAVTGGTQGVAAAGLSPAAGTMAEGAGTAPSASQRVTAAPIGGGRGLPVR